MTPLHRCLAGALLAASAFACAAHDTWFEPLPADKAGEVRLAAGTGNRFPVFESSVGEARLPAAACRLGRQAPQALQRVRDGERSQLMVARVFAPAKAASPSPSPNAAAGAATAEDAAHGAITCWAQLPSYDITLDGPVVQTYLDEVRAPAEVRQAWRDQAARGLKWRERYTKHLRIELFDARLGEASGPPPQASGLPMEILPDANRVPVGGVMRFVVLRDGQALPGFNLELVSANTAIGFWLQTDAAGRAEVRVPLPGRWLLRGTDIRPDVQRAEHWDSRFVTLAFEALAP